MILNWRDGDNAPFEMIRGAAVVDGNVAYFLHEYADILSFDSCSKKCKKLPKYGCKYSGLAVVNGQLTAIGGYIPGLEDTNKLFSLQTEWKEVFPPMPTKRSFVAAVTIKERLIVAGGYRRGVGSLTTVEVMDTKRPVWSTVASLPHPYTGASVTICGDQLYMLGGWDDKDKTKSVLTCSLTELLLSLPSSSSTWHRVADASAYSSTCAAVNGELLAVGGCDKDEKPSSALHKYNPTTDSWDLISNMPTARWRSLVAVLPANEIMVVGGYNKDGNSKIVEIANIIVYNFPVLMH
jgi:hypothetical protein